jgi:hypothetical protein
MRAIVCRRPKNLSERIRSSIFDVRKKIKKKSGKPHKTSGKMESLIRFLPK